MLLRLPLPNLEPTADRSPEEVVKIQLDLLQNADLGPCQTALRAAYTFTSPAGRASAGTFDTFVSLLTRPEYAPLIGYSVARLDPMIASRRKAYQRAHLQLRNREWVTYLFILSCQQEPSYIGCWMTDSVIRVGEEVSRW